MKSTRTEYAFFLSFFIFISVQIPCIPQNANKYIPLTFLSDGSSVSGKFFNAQTGRAAPAVILLHGFPGGEGDLFSLGKKFVSNGINAFTFSYRGMYKSEGVWLPSTSLEDIINSVKFLKMPEISKRYNVDTNQIILLGYSYGSSLALIASESLPSVDKIISLGTSDLSVVCNFIETSEAYRKGHQDYLDKYMSDTTIVRGLGGKGSHEWLIAHKDKYNLVKHAKILSEKRILLVGGWRDDLALIEDHTLPFYRELQKNDSKSVKIVVFDTDHAFRNYRKELYQTVHNWIVQ